MHRPYDHLFSWRDFDDAVAFLALVGAFAFVCWKWLL